VILGTNYPDMDMISFGPTIRGAHSPDERASISSQKILEILLEILEYSSEIVSSCQSYFQVVTETCEL
jgi:di/tripeptidase